MCVLRVQVLGQWGCEFLDGVCIVWGVWYVGNMSDVALVYAVLILFLHSFYASSF